MPANRLEILKTMLEADPSNSFAQYGIAMEYLNAGDLAEAAEAFGKLTRANPDYVAAYFHGGQTLEKLGRREDARSVYTIGLEACARTGDTHAQSEISAALDLL
jgi:tetratricopeptide (TPR) repeat protein